MNKQLLQKLKKRQLANNEVIEEKSTTKKQVIEVSHDPNRDQIKKRLENQFGGGNKVQVKVNVPKEVVPEGNKQGFMNAKKMLQMQLGGGKKTSDLPPPPSNTTGGFNLPPPPPPSGNIMNLPPPPPPPSIPSLDNLTLPPPPSLNTLDLGNLPPPPSLGNVILQPPPSLNTNKNTENKSNTINLPPPPSFNTNLPPPPSLNANNLPPPPSFNTNLPPPPSLNANNLPPPPSFNSGSNSSNTTNLPPPPSFNTSSNTHNSTTKVTINYNNNTNNLPPPPSFNTNLPPPPQLDNQHTSQHGQTRIPSLVQKVLVGDSLNQQQSNQRQQEQQAMNPLVANTLTEILASEAQKQPQKTMNPLITETFSNILGIGQSQQKQQVTQNLKESNRQRKKIFATSKKPSFSQQFFQKNISAFLKNDLFANTNIASLTVNKLSKKQYNFNFPSFEQGKRQKDQRKAIYFTTQADVVSSYLTFTENSANKQIVEQHRKGLRAFKQKVGVTQTKSQINVTYNWIQDPLKLLPVYSTFDIIPNGVEFEELDFNEIKKTRQKIVKIIKKFEKERAYDKCGEYNNIETNLAKMSQTFYKLDAKQKKEVKKKIQSIIEDIKKI